MFEIIKYAIFCLNDQIIAMIVNGDDIFFFILNKGKALKTEDLGRPKFCHLLSDSVLQLNKTKQMKKTSKHVSSVTF